MYLFSDQVDLWGPAPPPCQPAICLSDRFDVHALVSEEDYDWARRWNWSLKYAAGIKCAFDKMYAYRQIRVGPRKETVWLHREVAWRKLGPPPSPLHIISDHLNGDSLDCRRGNLRWATASENAKNKYGLMTR